MIIQKQRQIKDSDTNTNTNTLGACVFLIDCKRYFCRNSSPPRHNQPSSKEFVFSFNCNIYIYICLGSAPLTSLQKLSDDFSLFAIMKRVLARSNLHEAD